MSRILVIEDQADIRRLIRWALEFEHHEIFEANNGQAGLDLARRLCPDVVLLDVMMPGALDGYQVCSLLRADAQLAQTPVIMLTARAREQDRQVGEQAGANAYLAKPFSPKALVEAVEKLKQHKVATTPPNSASPSTA